MTSFLRSRQDAEELQAVLSGHADPELARRHEPLLRTVALLTEHPPVTPRPEFTTDLRERLLLAARTELVAAPAPVRRSTPAPTPTRRRLGTLAASVALVGGTAGMAAAAQGSLPGEPLYPIKRGAEQLVQTFQRDTASQGRTQLAHASERLDEALALQRADADPALVVRSLEEFRDLSDTGAQELFRDYQAESDPASVEAVQRFAAEQQPRLDQVDISEPAVQSATLSALDTLGALERQARTLCGDCGTATALPASATFAEAAGAPSIEALLVRPATQARLDRQALAELDNAQVKALGEAAEREADQAPLLPTGKEWPTTPATSRGPVGSTLATTVESVGGVVGGTVGGDLGGTVEETVKGTTGAVDDLVRGIGDGVSQVTDPLPKATGPLERPVRDVTDTLDDAVEGVSGVTGSLSGRLPTD